MTKTREDAIAELKEAGWKEGEEVCMLEVKSFTIHAGRDDLINVWYSWEDAIRNIVGGYTHEDYGKTRRIR